MADKFSNLPRMPVRIVDGNTHPATVVSGPIVAILGSASKGPAKVEVGLLSAPAGVARFGTTGSLGRGIAEAFQGGARRVLGYRLFTTSGKIEHIGDDSGAEGITVSPVLEGSDSLSSYNILYNQQTNRLKIYEVASGALVFDKTGDVVAVDLGVINVTGTAVNDATAEPGVFGSIGKALPVLDDETDQIVAVAAGNLVLTLPVGSNLGKLGPVATKPVMCQLRSTGGLVLEERLISSVDVAARTVTLAVATAVVVGAAAASVRFVSLTEGERMDKVVATRLAKEGDIRAQESELLVTPGSNFNGLPLLSNRASRTADTSLAEVEPHKMNIYEGLENAGVALEASEIDYLVLMDAYLDDPALDTQTLGETLLPITPAQGFMMNSAADDDAAIEDVVGTTVAAKADRILMTFDDATEQLLAIEKLSAAGRGASWITFSTPQGDVFGKNREADEIVRSARILNWESGSAESFTVTAVADVGSDLNNTYWTFSDGSLDFYVWNNVAGAGTDPLIAGKTGIEVTFAAAAADTVVAAAIKAAIEASDAKVAASVTDEVVTVLSLESLDLTDAVNVDAFAIAVTASVSLTVHLDRDVGFSLDSTGGPVTGAETPAFKVYNTDLLFFHRSLDVDGELVHFWYTEKTDPEGNLYNEVNFAYKLASICHELTENETSTLGVIGIRPPSNHFSPAAISAWIGKSPEYDEDGNVSANGSGLLGNKFISGRGLDDEYTDVKQFDPGFRATETGELDDENILLDQNDFEIDLGKYLSVVASWPLISNASDSSGLGYITSGTAIYAGLQSGLAPWRGTTAKPIGGRNIRLPTRLAKRHLNSLTGARYVCFADSRGSTTVVDGPSAALPTSDFTRNMTMRLVAEVVTRLRDVGRPYLGDPLDGIRKIALETQLNKELAEIQRVSDGALEAYTLTVSQSGLDKARGSARVGLTLLVINELRELTFSVSLTV